MNRCVDIAGARILTVDRGRQNEDRARQGRTLWGHNGIKGVGMKS